MRVFVYGSLLSGFGNHRLLEGSKFVAKGRTLPQYTMISLGGFPGVLSGGETSIIGEVYEVDRDVLARLDRLEGHPQWYKRTPITLEDGTKVELYIYPPEKHIEHLIVPNGDWRAYRERKQDRQYPSSL